MIPLVMLGSIQDKMMLVSPTEPSATAAFTFSGGVEAVGMRTVTVDIKHKYTRPLLHHVVYPIIHQNLTLYT